ncbi:MAG: hypothetical protein CMJ78_06135 [Planctomycetaceae bacterium]|nr:hypothetical protein [Planctomycetaceae bacterium]
MLAPGQTMVFNRLPISLNQPLPGSWTRKHPADKAGKYQLNVTYRHRFGSAPLDAVDRLKETYIRFELTTPTRTETMESSLDD